MPMAVILPILHWKFWALCLKDVPKNPSISPSHYKNKQQWGTISSRDPDQLSHLERRRQFVVLNRPNPKCSRSAIAEVVCLFATLVWERIAEWVIFFNCYLSPFSSQFSLTSLLQEAAFVSIQKLWLLGKPKPALKHISKHQRKVQLGGTTKA